MLYVTHSPAEAITVGTRLFLLEQAELSPKARRWTFSASIRSPTHSITWKSSATHCRPASRASCPANRHHAQARQWPSVDRPLSRAEPGTPVIVDGPRPRTSCWPEADRRASAANMIPGKVRADRPPRPRGRGPDPHRRTDLDRQPGRPRRRTARPRTRDKTST